MGSYVELNLTEGEKVKYEAKISLWSLWLPILLGGLTILLYVGPLFWIGAFLKWWTTELAVTNKKVIAKHGFIRRDTIELLLPKVESVSIQQGVIGRIFNFGTIVISGSGVSQAPISGISNPLIFRRKFLEIQEFAEKQ
jgi:uncharacterized membrane protein YdbT with pleckstrin-like domain